MTTAVIVLGILTWIPMAILLSLFMARVNKLSRPANSTIELPLIPAVTRSARRPAAEAIAGFPAEPARFAGRAEAMEAASAALAPGSGRAAVVFHGMAGAGKTTCAIELAHRHRRGFRALAFWSAPADPDQWDDSLRLFLVALPDLGLGMAQAEEIATPERLEKFLLTLAAAFADAGLLLVLDNVDTLLTPDGHWRDHRWELLIGALTGEPGSSRLIVTGQRLPSGLNPSTVLVRPIHALSQSETLTLVGELPGLCAALHSVALARQVLTLTQGHPQLLEIANAAAADPDRLAYQLADIEDAVDGAALGAFLVWGHTRLDALQLQQIVNTWIITVAATATAPARLLLQALCRADETDRIPAIIGENWPALWRRCDQPGEPPPLACALAPLISAALVVTDPGSDSGNLDGSGRYQIHPGVAAAIHSMTSEPVAAAVDAQLAAWWIGVLGGWAIDLPGGADASQLKVRASLSAARYLMRQQDWDSASCLLERALIRDGYGPATALAVMPLLRRIAEATGAAKDLVVLGAAVRKLDLGAAEALLRTGYHRATAVGDHQLASTSAGELVSLLRDLGELSEALTLATEKIEHTRQAGFGPWTQLSDQGRRLQILNLLGDHEQVLNDLPRLRSQMAALPEQCHNDRVDPGNTQIGILGIGRLSAVALERWDDALELNEEIVSTQRRRGAGPHEITRTRFNDYLPLLRLGRLSDADRLLRDCQDGSDTAGDIAQLALVLAARAELADTQHHPAEAAGLARSSLRLRYLHPDPREISAAHHTLANYLFRTAGNPAERCAHRLAASLINHLTGDTRGLSRTLGALADELRAAASAAGPPAIPTTLTEVFRLVDADGGMCLRDLVSSLCPGPAADRALADLLTTLE